MIGVSVVAKHVRPFAGIPYGGVVVALLLIQLPGDGLGKQQMMTQVLGPLDTHMEDSDEVSGPLLTVCLLSKNRLYAEEPPDAPVQQPPAWLGLISTSAFWRTDAHRHGVLPAKLHGKLWPPGGPVWPTR